MAWFERTPFNIFVGLAVLRCLAIQGGVMDKQRSCLKWVGLTAALTAVFALSGHADEAKTIHQATLGESNQRTAEVSTDEMRRILAERAATVLDARPHLEYAVSHIPGARNVAAKPGVPMSMYVSDVAEIGRIVNGEKSAPMVIYCNGPFCGKSKRLGDELLAAGFTNVRRYQLGIPVWRALGGVCEIELGGARNIPRSLVLEGKDVGEVKRAKDDGRLPMEDHNTRVIVLAQDPAHARYVAEAIAREAFHNVSYFADTLDEARAAVPQ